MKKIATGALLSMCLACATHAAGSISQYGITWHFDADYRTGTFANGDYWVLGPVTITRITPDFDGKSNGWEVNPLVGKPQGLDSAAGNFSSKVVPSLPYQALPGQSILKGISLPDPGYPACLEAAAVLTVVGSIPPDSGRTVFRPPYAGAEKPFYYVGDLRTSILPSVPAPSNAPSMAWVLKKYHRPQIEYQKGGTGRIIRPTGNYDLTDPYGSHVGRDLADAALALMLDYPLDDKMPALVAYIQGGIDRFHCHVLGQNWGSGGGYQPNCRLPLVFAAIMLDNQAMKDSVRHTDFFDDNMIHLSDKGAIIFGSAGYASERTYWDYLISPPSYNLERLDPYGYIDCGMNRVMLSDGYQECCLSMPWKGTAAAAYIMPELRAVFDDSVFLAYVDRWVTVGTWTQPDPCAPAEGIWHGGPNHGKRCTAAQDLPGDDDTCFIDESKYGVTYGPDGNGGCIKDTDLSDGIGRFPNRHGLKKNTGYYGSAFIDTMYGRFGHAAVSTAPHRLSHQGPGSLPRMMISSRNSGREVTIRIKAATGTGAVMLDIVDPRGRSVRRFAAEPAFSYATVVWDYRNTHGARIPAGMFIVRALSGDSEAAEMLIVGK